MSILKEIILNKRKEIDYLKNNNSISEIEKSLFFDREVISLKKSLIEKSGIISEFKRKSPSKPDINLDADVQKITRGYEISNSSGLSILTDSKYFGGSNEDITLVRNEINIPILRKDFILEEYQIVESKSLGADIILLIAACLSIEEVKNLSRFAKSFNLQVILEIHSEDEIAHLCDSIDVVGVNNRNLKKFETDINNSINLAGMIPSSFLKISEIEKSLFFDREVISLKKSLIEKSGIISEFKRKSPSKPDINLDADVQKITRGYEISNSSGLSILTDSKYFGGSNEDITLVRNEINIPILRKDFILEEYQIVESKSLGADIILLIAACLSIEEVKNLSRFAKSFNLQVILEIHSEDEIAHLCDSIDVVGVNNRNLKKFETDINNSINLASMIPSSFLKISESGISTSKEIFQLKEYGYDGFLIGENFMKNNDPVSACNDFINEL